MENGRSQYHQGYQYSHPSQKPQYSQCPRCHNPPQYRESNYSNYPNYSSDMDAGHYNCGGPHDARECQSWDRDFGNQPWRSLGFQPRPNLELPKPTLEELMIKWMAMYDACHKTTEGTLRNIEVQLEQMNKTLLDEVLQDNSSHCCRSGCRALLIHSRIRSQPSSLCQRSSLA